MNKYQLIDIIKKEDHKDIYEALLEVDPEDFNVCEFYGMDGEIEWTPPWEIQYEQQVNNLINTYKNGILYTLFWLIEIEIDKDINKNETRNSEEQNFKEFIDFSKKIWTLCYTRSSR